MFPAGEVIIFNRCPEQGWGYLGNESNHYLPSNVQLKKARCWNFTLTYILMHVLNEAHINFSVFFKFVIQRCYQRNSTGSGQLKNFAKNLSQMLLCHPQFLHGIVWERNRSSTLRVRRFTVQATLRHFRLKLIYIIRKNPVPRTNSLKYITVTLLFDSTTA